MHKLINRLVLGLGGLAALAGLSLAASTAAGATTLVDNGSVAGYQAGNGAWNFRYAQASITVPQNICSDDLEATGVLLSNSPAPSFPGLTDAGIGVSCQSGTPLVGWFTNSLFHFAGGDLAVAGDDNLTLQVYYNEGTGYNQFNVYNNTTGTSAEWFHKAGAATYHYASILTAGANPPHYASGVPLGSSFILVPVSGAAVTSLNGTHGAGITGQWGNQELVETNGAHTVYQAPDLYSGGSQFNVREYNNA
jgi:hypothetical protein